MRGTRDAAHRPTAPHTPHASGERPEGSWPRNGAPSPGRLRRCAERHPPGGGHTGAHCPLVLTALVLALATRYPVDVRHALATYALLPVGAGVLPTLVWPRLRPAWALMQIEHPKVLTALCTWVLAVVAVVALIAAAAALTSGAALADEGRRFALAVLTTGALALCALIITARFGIAWALGTTIVWTIFSVTIGGDVLAATPLWILAVPAWPDVADSTLRFAVALVAGVALLAVAWAGAGRALRGIAPLRR